MLRNNPIKMTELRQALINRSDTQLNLDTHLVQQHALESDQIQYSKPFIKGYTTL